MSNRSVLIIGSGSTGLATAAFLSEQGHRVTIWDLPEQAASFDAIREQDGVILQGGMEAGPVRIAELSLDIRKAAEENTTVFICVSAKRHEEIAEILAPLLNDTHCVLFSPGNLGSVILREKSAQINNNGYLVGEVSGNLWSCREIKPGTILLGGAYSKKKIAGYPTEDTPKLVERISPFFPVDAGKDIVETTLRSPNVVTHLCGSIMNASQIERQGDRFGLFETGLSESVVQCFNTLEKERNAVFLALGLDPSPSDEPFYRALMEEPVDKKLQHFKALKGPSSMEHRYICEDAVCGVSLLVSIAHYMNVPVPLTESYLTIASAVCRRDFLSEGRTLENLVPLYELINNTIKETVS